MAVDVANGMSQRKRCKTLKVTQASGRDKAIATKDFYSWKKKCRQEVIAAVTIVALRAMDTPSSP